MGHKGLLDLNLNGKYWYQHMINFILSLHGAGEVFLTLSVEWLTQYPKAQLAELTLRVVSKHSLIQTSQGILEKWPNPGLGGENA